MCTKCYESAWKANDDLLEKNSRFNLAEWISNCQVYEDYPWEVHNPKCTSCFKEFRSRYDIIVFVDWENGRKTAQNNRKSSKLSIRKAQAKRDK